MRHRRRGLFFQCGRKRPLVIVALLVLLQQPIWAATILVDEVGCLLVDAITAANTDLPAGGCLAGAGADTIMIYTGVTVTLPAPHPLGGPYGASGTPLVTTDITVEGDGAIIERAAAAPAFRIFTVASNGTLTLNQVWVRNGSAPGAGGGGVLTVGSTTVNQSTLSDNYAYYGGAIASFGGPVAVTNSTLSGNSAPLYGSAIYAYGNTTLTNSTLVGNTGYYSVIDFSYSMAVTRSIITGASCYGVADGGGNFTDAAFCPGAPITVGTDIDAALANNGGPTPTHALFASSVAIDEAACPLTVDQRKFPRDALCDSGSYEFQQVSPVECEDPGGFPQCDLPCPNPTDICFNTGADCLCLPEPLFCEDPGGFPQCDLPCPIPGDICVNTGADCRCETPPPVFCEDPGGFPQCDLPCPIPTDICFNTGADCLCLPEPLFCEDPGGFPQCDLPCPIPGDICVNTGADCRCETPPPVFCEDPGGFPQCDQPCPIPTDICVNTGADCLCLPEPILCEDPGGFPQCDLPCPIPTDICVPDLTGLPECRCEPPPPQFCEDPGVFPQCDLPCPIPTDICINTGNDCLCIPPPQFCEDPGVFPQCDLPCPIPTDICVNTGADCVCEPPPPQFCEDPGVFPQCDLPCPIPTDICINTGNDCLCIPPPQFCEDPGGFPQCDLPCPIPTDICVNTGADCVCEPPPPQFCEDPGGFPQCDLPCPDPTDICVNTGADCVCEPPPPVECEDPGGFPQCDLPCPDPATEICVNTGNACLCEPRDGACCRNGPGTETDCFITTEDDCLTNHHLWFGPGSECTSDIDCVELAVMLDSFSAQAVRKGVLLRWTTAMEIDTIGFRVLRQTAGTREKGLRVVAEFIPALGHGLAGASYELLDESRESALAVHYFLEDIDIHGRTTRHGPFAVERDVRRGPEGRVVPPGTQER